MTQTASIAFRNRVLRAGAFTDTGATFSSSQPLSNLARPQLGLDLSAGMGPTIFAQTDGSVNNEFTWQAQDSAGAAEDTEISMLSLLGLSCPNGTEIRFFDDTVLVAAATWHPAHNALTPHLFLPLPEPVTLDTLTCKIKVPTEGDVFRAGHLWASPRKDIAVAAEGFRDNVESLSRSSWAESVAWPTQGPSRAVKQFTLTPVDDSDAFGQYKTGNPINLPGTWDTDNSTGGSGDTFEFSAVDGTLLSESSYLSADTYYEVVVTLTQGASNAASVYAHIGEGNTQILQPGKNTLVGNSADGSPATTFRFASDAAFTGSLEFHSVKPLTRNPGMPYLRGIFEQSGLHEPLIVLMREGDQPWNQAAGMYGLLNRNPDPFQHIARNLYRVGFEMVEMR